MMGHHYQDKGLELPQQKLERALRLTSEAMKQLSDHPRIVDGLSSGHAIIRKNLRGVDSLIHAPKAGL